MSMKVRIDEIKVNPGRRAALEHDVEELAFSISEIGLLNPITLTGDYTLVAGLHRLEAVKLLGWTEVECTITDLDGLTAELAELDENFARTNLSPLEIGDLYRRRKDIYEMLYPETKAGIAQAIGMNKAKGNNVDTFAQMSRENLKDIQTAQKYVSIETLDAYALRELVQAIYVEAPDKSSGKRRQNIHIKYDGLGFIPLDELMKEETA